MTDYTNIANLPYPELTDPPNGPSQMQDLAEALDTIVIPKYSSSANRDSAIPSPTDGQMCYRTDLHQYQYYNAGTSSWITRYSDVQFVIKSANESRTSTTSPSNDAELFVSVQAYYIYRYEFNIIYDNVATLSADFKAQISVPSGTTGQMHCRGAHPDGPEGGGSNSMSKVDLDKYTVRDLGTEVVDFGCTNFDPGSCSIFGVVKIGSNSGQLRLQWAQTSSNSNATRVLSDSHVFAQRIGYGGP